MEKKQEYFRADIEVVRFEERDIVTTSGALGESKDPSLGWDSEGWT